MPTARLRSASLGADLELQGGATKAGPGTPGRRLTGPSEARLPPRRVLGSCPGGQWLGQGGAAEEQAGRTSGLAGRAGSPAAAPDAVAMVEKRVCHPFVHGLAPWFGAGSESLHEHHVPWGDVRPSPRPVAHARPTWQTVQGSVSQTRPEPGRPYTGCHHAVSTGARTGAP